MDDAAARRGFTLLASRDGRGGSIRLAQDADLLLARFVDGDARAHDLAGGRHAWVHVASGTIQLNGKTHEAGDGASVSEEQRLDFVGRAAAEVLLFDLA